MEESGKLKRANPKKIAMQSHTTEYLNQLLEADSHSPGVAIELQRRVVAEREAEAAFTAVAQTDGNYWSLRGLVRLQPKKKD